MVRLLLLALEVDFCFLLADPFVLEATDTAGENAIEVVGDSGLSFESWSVDSETILRTRSLLNYPYISGGGSI